MSNVGVHIGANLDQASLEAAANAVVSVIEAGYNAHLDQATLCRALDTLGRVGAVEGVTLSGCNFTMGKS